MCGILGFAGVLPTNRELQWDAALDSMAYRGPDARGMFAASLGGTGGIVESEDSIHQCFTSGPAVGLGHLRLSIIDLSESSNQPMLRNGLSLVFNGEI